MRIVGAWLLGDDGITRPVIHATVLSFDVILSRRRDEVLLLAPTHT